MTLCYTLLKYINSAYFGLRDEVTSLLSAIVLLGEKEVRRWASLVLFTLMGVDKPPEVVLRSLIRAQMCELLAADLGLKGHESELFLMGMFSMLDVLIGRPLEEILEEMNLTKEVKGALLGQENDYRDLYDLVVGYESGDWDKCFQSASKLNLDTKSIPESYLKAVDWAEEIVGVGSHTPK
jgi:EAL and modified HD-GYP domain-containing signal transduction protein